MSFFPFNADTKISDSFSDSQDKEIFEGQTTFFNKTSSSSIISPFSDIFMVIFQFSWELNVISWHFAHF